jgi:hypothetical protein
MCAAPSLLGQTPDQEANRGLVTLDEKPGEVEAPSGLEPLHRGFADLSLSHLGTTPRQSQNTYAALYCIGYGPTAQLISRQLAVGSWQLAVGSWQLAVGGRQSLVGSG